MIAYRPDIDGLRTVAILPVVLFHAGLPFMKGGYVGVDVFFVLSGFLITTIIARELDEERFSLLGFYERRARRILPALLFVIVGTLIAGAFILLPDALDRLGASVTATALFGSNIYFWRTLGYFAPAAEFEPLLHTWSLAVEEQFYIFFPLIMMAIYAFAQKARVAAIIGILTAISLVLAVIAVETFTMAAFYLTPFRAWELGLGSLLAVTRLPAIRSTAIREIIAFGALLAILIPVFFYTPMTPFPGLAAIPPVVGTAALVYIGKQENVVSRTLSMRPFVLVGLISYSLYLWHWPILALMRANKAAIELSFVEACIAVALSFVLAIFSYRVVEQPFRKRQFLAKRNPILVTSAASLVVFCALGIGIHLAQGFPARVSPDVTLAAAAAKDRSPYRRDCHDRTPSQGLCVIGADIDEFEVSSGNADFLIWGDSHADALAPAAQQAAQSIGARVAIATSTACIPVARLGREGGKFNAQCEAFNDGIVEILTETDRYPTVILSARWAFSAEGTRYGEEEGGDVSLTWENPLQPVDAKPSANAAILTAALDQTVATIRATGRRVIILGPTPEIGWNVPQRLAHSRWSGQPTPPVPSEEAVELRTQRAVALLMSVAAENGADYIDTLEPICTGGCKIFAGDAIAFADDDHLTATGARYFLTPLLTDVFSSSGATKGS